MHLTITCLIFRHAHPGIPYVFGLVGDDHDLDFPEPMPVVGMLKYPLQNILICFFAISIYLF